MLVVVLVVVLVVQTLRLVVLVLPASLVVRVTPAVLLVVPQTVLVVPHMLLVVLETLTVEPAPAFSGSSFDPKYQEGNSTGVRNTMMQTIATRHPPAIPSNLRLCSSAPRRTAKKNPLSRKKRTMLTELFTRPGYQNGTPADTAAGTAPPDGRHPLTGRRPLTVGTADGVDGRVWAGERPT